MQQNKVEQKFEKLNRLDESICVIMFFFFFRKISR